MGAAGRDPGDSPGDAEGPAGDTQPAFDDARIDDAEGPAGDTQPALEPSIFGDFGPELADLVERILGVGAAIARTVAQATEPGGAQTGTGPIAEIVRNGADVVANLVRLTVNSLRASTEAPAPPGGATSPRRAASHPSVRAGDTLRMPLFIENPTSEPTGPLGFQALSTECVDPPGGVPLSLTQVRCNPDVLQIDGRDFEKLTIFVDTAGSTTVGRHRVRVGVPESAFVTTVEFDVLAVP